MIFYISCSLSCNSCLMFRVFIFSRVIAGFSLLLNVNAPKVGTQESSAKKVFPLKS